MNNTAKVLLATMFVLLLSACNLTETVDEEELLEALSNVENVALNKDVVASTELNQYKAELAVDGIYNTSTSRWTSRYHRGEGILPPHWLEIDLAGRFVLYKAEVWTGNLHRNHPDNHEMAEAAVKDFKLQYWVNGQWVDIPGGTVEGNSTGNPRVELIFTQPITTEKVRLYTEEEDNVRFREVMIFGVPAE